MENLSPQKKFKQEVSRSNIGRCYSDEGDLKAILFSLWAGKLVILMVTLAFTIIALIYSFMSEERWVTVSKITEPQLNSFSELQLQVAHFQPLFKATSGLSGNKLDTAISSKVLMNTFIQEFNRAENKSEYFYERGFSTLKQMKILNKSVYEQTEKGLDVRLFGEWGGSVSLSIVKKKNTNYAPNSIDDSPKEYRVTAAFSSANGSYELLQGYIEFVKEKSQVVILSNLNSLLESKGNELLQERVILTDQAQKKLDMEIQRTVYGLNIAKAAGLITPLKGAQFNKGFLDIGLGVELLKAKVEELEGINSLDIFESGLSVNNAKINFIKNNSIDQNIKFDVIQFLELPKEPQALFSPNRKLMIILGGVFGFGLGVVLVLISSAFRESEKD